MLRDRVHVFLEASEMGAGFAKACAVASASKGQDISFFKQDGIDYDQYKSVCDARIAAVQADIRRDWAKMRMDLALARPDVEQEVIAPSDMSLFSASPQHYLHGLAGMEPLSSDQKNDEVSAVREQAKKDLDSAGEVAHVPHLSQDLFAGKLRISEGTQISSRVFRNAQLSQDPLAGNPTISEDTQRKVLGEMKRIRSRHYADYLATLQQDPILGFISHVDPNDSNSPSPQEIGNAFGKVASRLHGYRKDLKKGYEGSTDGCQGGASLDGYSVSCVSDSDADNVDWKEYLGYPEVIDAFVREHPQQCCGSLDSLKALADRQVRDKELTNAALYTAGGFVAGVLGNFAVTAELEAAAVANFALGSTAQIVASAVVRGSPYIGRAFVGGGVGVAEIGESMNNYDQVLARNLTLAFDDAKLAHFSELDDAQRRVGVRELMLPIMMGGVMPASQRSIPAVKVGRLVGTLKASETPMEAVSHAARAAALVLQREKPRPAGLN